MGRSDEFMFWEERLPVSRGRCEDESLESQLGASSPTLWRRGRIELRPETSTLLPQNHQYSCLSPTSRLRAILDSRRELMEMIKDMPESSHELTLYLLLPKRRRRRRRRRPIWRDLVDVFQREEMQIKRTGRVPLLSKSAHTCKS